MSSPNVVQGQALGSGLSFFNGTALSAFQVGTVVPLGTTVYTTSDGHYWQLLVSSTGPDSTHLAVAGLSGLRWVQVSSGGIGSVVAGAGITVDSTSPTAPIVKLFPGNRQTAASNQASLTWSGLDGAVDGGYEITATVFDDTGSDHDYVLQLNGVTSGYTSIGLFSTGAGISHTETGNFGAGANTTGHALGRIGGASSRNRLQFRAVISNIGAAGTCFIEHRGEGYQSTDGTAQQFYVLTCAFVLAAKVTSIALLRSDANSTGIRAGTTGLLVTRGQTN